MRGKNIVAVYGSHLDGKPTDNGVRPGSPREENLHVHITDESKFQHHKICRSDRFWKW